MKYSKSFRYDSDEWPQVHKWIQDLDEQGKDFSEAVRRLISGQPSDVMAEIKKLLAALAEKGVKIEPVYEQPEQSEQSFEPGMEEEVHPIEELELNDEPTTLKVNVGFIKKRYF